MASPFYHIRAAAQLTPLRTGRDNRGALTDPQTLLPRYPLSVLILRQQFQGPRSPEDLRALVCQRGGLTDYVFKVAA